MEANGHYIKRLVGGYDIPIVEDRKNHPALKAAYACKLKNLLDGTSLGLELNFLLIETYKYKEFIILRCILHLFNGQ